MWKMMRDIVQNGTFLSQVLQETLGSFDGAVYRIRNLLEEGLDLLDDVGSAAFEGGSRVFADRGVDHLLVVGGEGIILVHILLHQLFELGVGLLPLFGGEIGAFLGDLVGQFGEFSREGESAGRHDEGGHEEKQDLFHVLLVF